MARARSLKPGFFTNDELAETGPLGMLLFEGLWCHADREGRLEDRPRRLKAGILPYFEADVDALLDALAARGFVVRYEANGVRYLQVVNFAKHQNPHVKEAHSAIPDPDDNRPESNPAPVDPEAAPDEHGASTGQAPEAHRESRADSGLPVTDSGLRTPGGVRAVPKPPRRKPAPPAAARPSPSPAFALFQAICEELGVEEIDVKRDWKEKQIGLADRLLADGYSEADVLGHLRYLRSDPYWHGKTLDLTPVRSQIGSWVANKRPPVYAARAPTPLRGAEKRQQQADDIAAFLAIAEGHQP